MANRTLQQWFDEYGEGHRNPVNITVHWVAVPLIYFSMVGLLMAIPAPAYRYVDHYLWAFLAMGAVWIFYMQRSFSIAIGMVIFNVACLWAGRWLDQHAAWPLWAICLSIFVLAWIAQFIGHGVERKKPSFLKDLLFLLIGPAWLMAKLYRRLGIAY